MSNFSNDKGRSYSLSDPGGPVFPAVRKNPLALARLAAIAWRGASARRCCAWRLRPPPQDEEFSYRDYLIFPAPEAPLLAGILLGIDTGIPPALAQAFQDTGTARIIAISGFTIMIPLGV